MRAGPPFPEDRRAALNLHRAAQEYARAVHRRRHPGRLRGIVRAAADDDNPRRRRHLRQHQVHQQKMPKMVDGERRLEAIFGEGSAGHDLCRRVAYDRAQRRPPFSRVVARKISHRLERGEVQRHRFDFFVPCLRRQPLHRLATLFGAATSDDDVPVASLGERSSALEAQASVGAGHDGGVHLRDDCILAKLMGVGAASASTGTRT